MSHFPIDSDQEGVDQAVTCLRDFIRQADRVLVLTGAGISTDSGIPDFRGPKGVWTKNPEAEKMATISHYVADPEVRKRAWKNRAESATWNDRASSTPWSRRTSTACTSEPAPAQRA